MARCTTRLPAGTGRIVGEVEPLPASFGRPEGFDVLRYLSDAMATLPRAHSVELLLHTDLDTARRHLSPALARLKESRGSVRMLAQADDLQWMARDLARLPFTFKVLKPAALRMVLKGHLQALMQTL